MKRPSNLRISSYISNFPLPGEKFACSIHGYSAAVDVLRTGLASDIEASNLQACLAESSVEKFLEQRGYITTKSAEEEDQFVSKIKELFWRKQPFIIEFAVELGSAAEGEAALLEEPGYVDNLFLAMNELREINVGSVLEVNVLQLDVGRLAVLKNFFSLARDWDFKLHIIIDYSQLQEVAKHIVRDSVEKLTIQVEEPDEPLVAQRDGSADLNYPFDCLLGLIANEVRIECLVNIDSLPLEAVEGLINNISLTRSLILTGNEAQLVLVPTTHHNGSRETRMVADGVGVVPLRLDELSDYRQLEAHMWSERLVRFRPCFSQSDRRFEIFSSGKIFLLTDFGRGSIPVGQVLSDNYQIDLSVLERPSERKPLNEVPDECAACKLSLICGGNCNVWNPAVGEHFKDKLTRLVTIPFINHV